MTLTQSFVEEFKIIPSAVISDGLVTIPLFAVTEIRIDQTYHLPPIGSTGARVIVSTHDDTIRLSASLVGDQRFAWKFALETLADASKRGTALGAYTGGTVGGLILVTAMTIRTDMQVESLSFAASATRRAAIDVGISLVHVPRPGALGKLFDVASLGIAALADWGSRG